MAQRGVVLTYETIRHKGLNNRAENSHQPTRLRERVMRIFKSAGPAQRFLSAFEIISQQFRPKRDLLKAKGNREEIELRLATWQEGTRRPTAA